MNHIQGQSSVSVYFAKLKTILEELGNYKQVYSRGKYSCDSIKKLVIITIWNM